MGLKSLVSRFGQRRSGHIFLGAPEAEAEALPKSKMPLSQVYEDYHHLLDSLQNEKFIICGRKGCGKSAFAEYVAHIASQDANVFCKFIRQGESHLEKIVQIGISEGHPVERESLYQWLIYTNILKLFADNHAVQSNKDYQLLSQFLQRNSGYVDIRHAEIKELVRKSGFEVNIEYLKRFLSQKGYQSIEIKQERAPFYKLIPHLKEVVQRVLSSEAERENGNSYILFFDDLDIGFNSNDPDSIESITSLIRISKEVNNELFAKNDLDSKVVILLRDDIAKVISSHSSDTAKVFGSYATFINWYQDEYHRSNPETDLNIRKFINSRVRYAFREEGFPAASDDAWHNLVEDPFSENVGSEAYQKTSFKYVLDHTFFRPRDLIQFFLPLQMHIYQFPLVKHDINQLIGRYCDEIINELKNELSSFYSPEEIQKIFVALGGITASCRTSPQHAISYSEAANEVSSAGLSVDPRVLLEDLFERSFIGNMAPNGNVFFKHREPKADTYSFSAEHRVVLHSAIRVYSSNRGYA